MGSTFIVTASRQLRRLARPAPILLLVLIFAAVTRLGWPNLVEFKSDESAGLSIAASIAQGRSWPLVGVSDWSGSPYPPFFVYLMALPELLSRDPALASSFIGLLDVLAIAATFELGSILFGRAAGTAAALFYAVSPWGIIYSRKVWDQDALPLFVTLGFYCLIRALIDRRRFLIVPGLVLLTFATQLHPTAYALAAPAVVLLAGCLWLDRPHGTRSIPWLVGSLLACFVIEAPFIVWQVQNGWPLLDVVHRLGGTDSQIDVSAIRLAASAAIGSGYPTLAQVPNDWRVASVIEAVLFVVGVLVVARQIWSGQDRARQFVGLSLGLWLAAPVLPQIRHSIPLWPHYFIVLYPLPFLLMGLATTVLWRATWPLALGRVFEHRRVIAASRLAAIVGIAIPAVIGPVAFSHYIVALQDNNLQPAFGLPLAGQKSFIALAQSTSTSGKVYLAAHGDLAKSLDYLTAGHWRVFDDQTEFLLPSGAADSTLVIVEPTSYAGHLAAEWFADKPGTVVPLPEDNVALLYRVAPVSADSILLPGQLPASFEDGLTLRGFRANADPSQNQVQLDLRWSVESTLPTRVPTVFNHLVDSSGATVAQVDGLAYQRLDWKPGDDFVTQFSMKRPAGATSYDLQVGLYDFASMRRYPLVTPAPGSSSDAVDLGRVGATLPPIPSR